MGEQLPAELKSRFMTIARKEFGYAEESFDPDAGLINDLGFDSIEFLRLGLLVEALVPGSELPVDLDFQSLTFGVVFELVLAELNRRREHL